MQDDILINKIPHSLKNSKIYDVVVTDLKGNYAYVNETFKNRFSFITDEFVGKSSAITMHPEERAKMEALVNKCFEHPFECFPVEIRKPLKDKKGYNWTQWESSVLSDENLQPIGILCVGFDITGPQHNNMKFKESQTKLTKTIEAIPHPLLILCEESYIIYVNNEFENIFGYSPREILGEKLEILFQKDKVKDYNKLFSQYIDDSAKKMRVNHFLNFVNKKDENVTVGISLNSFYDNDNLNVIVILEDLTVAKENQDTIVNQNNAFKKIAWKHSHELRKPVANILGLSNLLNIENLQSETNYKTISFLKEAANELDHITRDIVKDANESEYEIKFKKHKRNLY
ncbi:MAG: PAS domain S-box protein [Psychroflexus sp.]